MFASFVQPLDMTLTLALSSLALALSPALSMTQPPSQPAKMPVRSSSGLLSRRRSPPSTHPHFLPPTVPNSNSSPHPQALPPTVPSSSPESPSTPAPASKNHGTPHTPSKRPGHGRFDWATINVSEKIRHRRGFRNVPIVRDLEC